LTFNPRNRCHRRFGSGWNPAERARRHRNT